jgi:hypothetical protein
MMMMEGRNASCLSTTCDANSTSLILTGRRDERKLSSSRQERGLKVIKILTAWS